jgi:predicted membrane protein
MSWIFIVILIILSILSFYCMYKSTKNKIKTRKLHLPTNKYTNFSEKIELESNSESYNKEHKIESNESKLDDIQEIDNNKNETETNVTDIKTEDLENLYLDAAIDLIADSDFSLGYDIMT